MSGDMIYRIVPSESRDYFPEKLLRFIKSGNGKTIPRKGEALHIDVQGLDNGPIGEYGFRVVDVAYPVSQVWGEDVRNERVESMQHCPKVYVKLVSIDGVPLDELVKALTEATT